MDCRIYRCSRQPELYLYLPEDADPDTLPEALRQRVGRLTEVMRLRLDRPLARVDVAQVRQALATQGYFLQLPPAGQVAAHLYAGD
jgi:uncharacterized protein